jgi:hypothetical protein
MWAVTLIIDGQTRLKTLPLKWSDYDRTERSILIDELRQLCITELKKRSSSFSVRLEFSEVPRQLEDMLIDLGGDENPEFTWGTIPSQ